MDLKAVIFIPEGRVRDMGLFLATQLTHGHSLSHELQIRCCSNSLFFL